jgi:hypothetical protein
MLVAALFVGAAALFPSDAFAQFHPQAPYIDYTVSTQGGFKDNNVYGRETSDYQSLGTPDTLQHAESGVLNLGVPFLAADAESSGTATAARATASMIYSLQVNGPSGPPVPIIVHVSSIDVHVSRSGGSTNSVASARATMTIANDSYNTNSYNFYATYDAHATDQFGAPFDSGNNFVYDTQLTTLPNYDLVTITMNVSANDGSNSNADSSGKAFATLDPYIYIDPSFPNADQYTLTLSPGVSNTPASVPETSPALFSAGALAALLLRRR